MPIRINLLAETQAAEELRRRDPVKRAILVGVLLVALMLVWYSYLVLRAMSASSGLNEVQAGIQMRTNQFQRAIASQTKLNDTLDRIAALKRLNRCRFLNGNLLNALQHTTVPGVALTGLRVQQSFFLEAGTPPRTNGTLVVPGKPATATERVLLTLDARDFSPNPGDQVNAFKSALARNSYFKSMLSQTNGIRLTDLSAPQMGANGKPFVLFTLECHYPDHTR